MLHELESYRRSCARHLGINDITVVLAVRLHDGNPWVLERLSAIRTHYEPLPPVLVVDFGSEPAHAARLADVCREHDFALVYEDDHGTFSLARARNLGAAAARTPLVFFNDIDCFGERRFFERLVDHANALEMGSHLEQVVDVPVYHFPEATTAGVWALATPEARARAMVAAMTRQVYDAVAKYSYVDPSSNFFLIRRDFFDLIGGYNESFRGHGSEDFEFFLRLAHYTRQFPLPAAPSEEIYSPIRESYYTHRAYRGFRRYCELLAFQAEAAGLRLCHLYHPRGNDAWHRDRDRGKSRFARQVAPFLEQPARLLGYDWMPRTKRALVLIKHPSHYEYFTALRFAGYRLQLALAGDAASEAAAREGIARRDFDAVAVFNPYMSSHAPLRPLVEAARSAGIPLIVVDRGMLPESWFFASDMPYADPEFHSLDLASRTFSDEQLQIAREYAQKLRAGGVTLEANGDLEATLDRRRARPGDARRTVFVPLQLDDDVAVTRFDEGFLRYRDFVEQIQDVARHNRAVRFLVKPHPLSKGRLDASAPNVVLCSRDDNVHALIELSDAVVCYNSGVGFLASIHGKRVVTVGNAFYNLAGIGHRAATFLDAVRAVDRGLPAPSRDLMDRYLAWLLFEKYAFASATSVIEERGHRRTHGYRNLLFYRLPFGEEWSTLRASLDRRFTIDSYASGKLAVKAGLTSTRSSAHTGLWSVLRARWTGMNDGKSDLRDALSRRVRALALGPVFKLEVAWTRIRSRR